MTQALDICIRGDGVVGSSLALLLAREHLRVGLVRSQRPALAQADIRAYALNAPSRAVLESLRCWPADPLPATVQRMEVRGDEAGEVNFSAAELGVEALAWIVDVAALEHQLSEAVRFQSQIQSLTAPQDAALTVICEGRLSQTRDEISVDVSVTPYAQTAIAARLQAQYPHTLTARQWFAGGDVLAFLPLGGPQSHTVSLVWSVSTERSQQLLALDPVDFCRQIEQASGSCLGLLTLESERQAWPLQMTQANHWTGLHLGRAWALAGDAAHSVHPLAGQGLNLGLADVAALVRVVKAREYWRSIGDLRLLRRYERERKASVIPAMTAMDGLQQLFATDRNPWQALRNWGMNGFDRCGPVKRWAARQAMGLG